MATTNDVWNEIGTEDTTSYLFKRFSEKFNIKGEVTAVAKYYASDSFIIDHPTLGVIDSPTLKIDGGYDDTKEETIYTTTL